MDAWLVLSTKEGEPIKKPWAIQTDCDSIVTAFDGLSCDGSHNHVQGEVMT